MKEQYQWNYLNEMSNRRWQRALSWLWTDLRSSNWEHVQPAPVANRSPANQLDQYQKGWSLRPCIPIVIVYSIYIESERVFGKIFETILTQYFWYIQKFCNWPCFETRNWVSFTGPCWPFHNCWNFTFQLLNGKPSIFSYYADIIFFEDFFC